MKKLEQMVVKKRNFLEKQFKQSLIFFCALCVFCSSLLQVCYLFFARKRKCSVKLPSRKRDIFFEIFVQEKCVYFPHFFATFRGWTRRLKMYNLLLFFICFRYAYDFREQNVAVAIIFCCVISSFLSLKTQHPYIRCLRRRNRARKLVFLFQSPIFSLLPFSF